MVTEEFWDVALDGELSHFEPIREGEDLTRILELFQDERLFEIGAGIGFAPSMDTLRKWLFENRHIQIWTITPHTAEAPTGLAVYTVLTTIHRISVFFWDTPLAPPPDLWRDAMETLSTHVFAFTDTNRVFSHFLLPVAFATHTMFSEAGWERWNNELRRDPERAIYGLERAVFDLYHAPVIEDEDDDL